MESKQVKTIFDEGCMMDDITHPVHCDKQIIADVAARLDEHCRKCLESHFGSAEAVNNTPVVNIIIYCSECKVDFVRKACKIKL